MNHKLQELADTTAYAGIPTAAFATFEAACGLRLPSDYKEFLAWSNGLSAYAGYYRLFGWKPAAGIDAVLWNQHEYWKFAWEEQCVGFWCFGESAWGDQYAYSVQSLVEQAAVPVYWLDAFTMSPELIAESFAEFIEQEFIPEAQDPTDEMIRHAREKLGPLGAARHLAYVPSLLLGGPETIDHIVTMDARAAMICNGDIAMQLNAIENGSVRGVSTYQDSLGRTRLRLDWAED